MMATRTVQELAQELAEAFEGATRTDGAKYRRLKDGSPEWMSDVIREAHGDMLPDDWRYECIEDAAVAIADADGADELDELEFEFSDNVDVYSSDLIAWLGSHGHRQGYCDDAVDELGYDGKGGIESVIRCGQFLERREVFASVLRQLEELAEDEEDEDDARPPLHP